jgi:hypothetical protein
VSPLVRHVAACCQCRVGSQPSCWHGCRIDASQSIESVEEQLLAIPEFQMEYQRRVRQGNAPSQ